MQEWKENVMQEVARKLHIIRQMHEATMEAQRQSFQLELERVGEKVEQLQLEVKALRFLGHHLARKIPPAKAIVSSSSDGQERGHTEQLKNQNKSHAHDKDQHTEKG